MLGKGYSSSSLIILSELENRLPLLKPTCPPKATKEVHAEGCPLNKVWLNGNCPSAMRAHSIVSLSLFCMPEPARPSSRLPRKVDLQGAVLTLPSLSRSAGADRERMPAERSLCLQSSECVPRPCGGSLGCRSVQTLPPHIGSELELRSLASSQPQGHQLGHRRDLPAAPGDNRAWCQHLPQGRNVETVNAPSK